MLAIVKFFRVKKYYNKKIKKIQEENFHQDTQIDSNCLGMVYEMSWKYYEAEISRGNKIISKARTYSGAVSLTLSFFTFASNNIIVSIKGYTCYQVFIMAIFMITIAYFLLAVISAMAAIKLTNVHKIGDADIMEIKGMAMSYTKPYKKMIKANCQKHIIGKLIRYTKLNEQLDNALTSYVYISQECYRKGIIGMIICLACMLIYKYFEKC